MFQLTPLTTTLSENNFKNIKLILQDGQKDILVPVSIVPLTSKFITELSFPHNKLDQTTYLFDIMNYMETILKENRLCFRCAYDDTEKNLQSLHSACLCIEFFQKLGWKVHHFLSDGMSEPGISRTGYNLTLDADEIDKTDKTDENDEKSDHLQFSIYIHSNFEHKMTMKTYDSLRISTGYINPASLLAITLTEKSVFKTNKEYHGYYQFYFDYHYNGKDVIKFAFTQLNDIDLDPFHDYLVEYIGRAITTPWRNKEMIFNVVNFLTAVPERLSNFERWFLKTYEEINLLPFAHDLLKIINNNISHLKNKIKFDQKSLVNEDAEKWWVISRLNDKKYEPKKNQ